MAVKVICDGCMVYYMTIERNRLGKIVLVCDFCGHEKIAPIPVSTREQDHLKVLDF